MKIVLLSMSISAACAFAPSTSRSRYVWKLFRLLLVRLKFCILITSFAARDGRSVVGLGMSDDATPVAVDEEPAPKYPTLNGWTPDESLPLWGLPGSSAPLGFFDPLGFSKDKELTGAKRLREAEIMHGRVGMMAVIGYLIQENTPTIAYGMSTDHTIANDEIPQVPGTVLFPFFLAINIAEAYRAALGWVEPGLGPLFTLRESYYPGDLKFDPFGLKPEDPEAFANMQTKELNNGRLVSIMSEYVLKNR